MGWGEMGDFARFSTVFHGFLNRSCFKNLLCFATFFPQHLVEGLLNFRRRVCRSFWLDLASQDLRSENGPMFIILFFVPHKGFWFSPPVWIGWGGDGAGPDWMGGDGPDQTRWGGHGAGPDRMGPDRTGRGGGRTGATSAEQRLLMDLVLARMSILEEIPT